MSTIFLKGAKTQTLGDLPAIGTKAKDFSLVSSTLEPLQLSSFSGKKKILNIFPSLDTSTCSRSVKTFEEKASSDTVVFHISRDTPFAHGRFCTAEGIAKGISASDVDHAFGDAYGLTITDGPLKHFLSRAVIVLDETDTVVYTEQVSEIASEPNYEAALKAL